MEASKTINESFSNDLAIYNNDNTSDEQWREFSKRWGDFEEAYIDNGNLVLQFSHNSSVFKCEEFPFEKMNKTDRNYPVVKRLLSTVGLTTCVICEVYYDM